MIETKRAGRWMFLLAAVAGLAVSQTALAAGAKFADQVTSPVISDVALQDGGLLTGQLLDSQGQARKGIKVALFQGEQLIATTQTDASGRFFVRGLRGGVYQIETDRGGAIYRLWAPRTAPPSAQKSVLVVNDNVVRGQKDMGTLDTYGPAIRGAVAGGVITALGYWAIDYNPDGS